MSIHSQLQGDNVHEPKGANTASSGDVIKASGTGLTSWVPLFILRTLRKLSYIVRPVSQSQIMTIEFTGKPITDNTMIEEIPTTVEPLNEGVLDKDALTNKNFAAVLSSLNNMDTSLTTNIDRIDQNTQMLTQKVNEIAQLLQDLTITKESEF